MTASEVLNQVDTTEFNALTDAEENRLWGLLGMGTLDPWGVEADAIQKIFGPSTTVTNLSNARTESISRAVELGLGVAVTAGSVDTARNHYS